MRTHELNLEDSRLLRTGYLSIALCVIRWAVRRQLARQLRKHVLVAVVKIGEHQNLYINIVTERASIVDASLLEGLRAAYRIARLWLLRLARPMADCVVITCNGWEADYSVRFLRMTYAWDALPPPSGLTPQGVFQSATHSDYVFDGRPEFGAKLASLKWSSTQS